MVWLNCITQKSLNNIWIVGYCEFKNLSVVIIQFLFPVEVPSTFCCYFFKVSQCQSTNLSLKTITRNCVLDRVRQFVNNKIKLYCLIFFHSSKLQKPKLFYN